MTKDEMEALHNKASYHRDEMMRLGKYVCFYCTKRRPLAPEGKQEWIDGGQTAVCVCLVDACLPDDGTITDKMIADMRKYWFDD